MSEIVDVNPITCEAHGMCAELLPERISLDEWGYPIVDGRPLTPELVEHARRAVDACPTFALLLRRQAAAEPPRRAPAGSSPARAQARRPRRRPSART